MLPLRRIRIRRRTTASALLLLFAGAFAGIVVEGSHHHLVPVAAEWHGDHDHGHGEEGEHTSCGVCSLAGSFLALPLASTPPGSPSAWTVLSVRVPDASPPRIARGVSAQPRAPPAT